MGRHRDRRAPCWIVVARQLGTRHPDEHARPGRADRAQHRPRSRRHHAPVVYDAGDHGAGHHNDDDAGPHPPDQTLVHVAFLQVLMYKDNMSAANSEVPYGTLDLMVLKTLAGMGPLHGYGIARRIEQVADGSLALNQGTIYPALLRLEQKGWIKSGWGTSENNRR